MTRTLRALVTRPEADAAPLANALRERGHAVAIEPLLTIRPVAGATVDLEGVQAILFTSANGVRAFAELSPRRDLPVFAVGDATAEAARAAGFARVESAAGDVQDLARLVRARLGPDEGALFHAAGSAVAGDLAGLLAEAGFELRRAHIYEAKTAEALGAETRAALAAGGFDIVLFFSPRSAVTFAGLVETAPDAERLKQGLRRTAALCLSPMVAAAAKALPWRAVLSAERPELPALLALVDRLAAEPAAPEAATPAAAPAPAISPASRAAAPPPAAAPRPRPGATGGLLAGVAAAALVALAVAGTAPAWAPALGLPGWRPPAPAAPAPDPAAAARLAALEGALAALTDRLAALEATARTEGAGAAAEDRLAALEAGLEALAAALEAAPRAEPPALPAGIERLPERIGALEARLAELGAATAQAAVAVAPETAAAIESLRRENQTLRTALEALQARLDEAAAAEDRADGAALVLAVGQLRGALAAARPFERELQLLRDLAAGDPAIAAAIEPPLAPLADHAAAGVPTLAQLQLAFPPVAAEVARAALAADAAAELGAGAAEEPGWAHRLVDQLGISVRPVGPDVAGEDPPARAARAEAKLAAGDLAGAVAELEGLSGPAAEAAADWLAAARARLAADEALAELQAAAVARLAGPPMPAAEPQGEPPAAPAASTEAPAAEAGP